MKIDVNLGRWRQMWIEADEDICEPRLMKIDVNLADEDRCEFDLMKIDVNLFWWR